MRARSLKRVVLSGVGKRNAVGLFAGLARYVVTMDVERKAGLSVREWEEGDGRRSGVE